MAPSHSRRRSRHRPPRSFLEVTEAESAADVHALTARLKRAILQAEVLAMPEVVRQIETAIDTAEGRNRMDVTIAGEPVVPKSIGQHDVEP